MNHSFSFYRAPAEQCHLTHLPPQNPPLVEKLWLAINDTVRKTPSKSILRCPDLPPSTATPASVRCFVGRLLNCSPLALLPPHFPLMHWEKGEGVPTTQKKYSWFLVLKDRIFFRAKGKELSRCIK